MRRVFLSSTDRLNPNGGTALRGEWSLNDSRLSVKTNEELLVGVSQFCLPASLAVTPATTQRLTFPTDECSLVHFTHGPGGDGASCRVYFNDILEAAPGSVSGEERMPLTTLTTIDNVINAMNNLLAGSARIIKYGGLERVGSYRLVLRAGDAAGYGVKILGVGSPGVAGSSSQIVNALGLEGTTLITNSVYTPLDYNMAVLMPRVMVTSPELQTNSFSSNEACANALCSIPCVLKQSSVPKFLDTVSLDTTDRSVLLRSLSWNYTPHISRGSMKILAARNVSTITIEIRNQLGQVIYGGGGAPFSCTLDFAIRRSD